MVSDKYNEQCPSLGRKNKVREPISRMRYVNVAGPSDLV